MGGGRTARAALAAAAALALAGCASLLPGARSGPALDADGLPVASTPELDFLVARDLELSGELEEALRIYGRALAKDPEAPELLRKVAELSARAGQLDAAVAHAERAYALDRSDRSTRLFLGTLYRFLHQEAKVEEVLREPDGQPFDPDAALLLYGTLVEAKRYPEAVTLARWLIDHDDDGLRGWFALADVREKMGDVAGAEAALREGLAAHPGELALYGALARGRRDRDDRAGEIEVYREILRFEPRNTVTLLALAEALIQLDRFDEAAGVLEQVLREDPDDGRTLLRLGFLEFERRRYERARDHFERALAKNPEQHEVTYFLGVVLRRLNELDRALAAFERIPPGHERYPEARTQIAGIYERRGDFERAMAEVERARGQGEARPLDLYAASLRSRAGDFDGALAFLQELLEQAPDDAELLYNIGMIHGEAQRSDEALRWMEKALEKQPDHAGALNYIGYSLAERGEDLDRAEDYVTKALETKPEDGYIVDSLGWVFYMRAQPLLRAGRVGEARALLERSLRELERARSLTGGDPVISEHLGDVYRLLEQKQRALEHYEEALALEPREQEQPELQRKLEALKRELGRP
jgi:tetratricopeptide (TPR) repeat protein